MAEPQVAQEHESAQTRVNRELIELLNEVRVALPGVQMLFGFLITVPFAQRFVEVGTFDRWLYFGVLISSATSGAFLMAPASYHRLRFRAAARHKETMLITCSRFAVAGMVLLASSMSGAVFLITHFVFGILSASIAGALIACAFGLLWFALPLVRRHREGANDEAERAAAKIQRDA